MPQNPGIPWSRYTPCDVADALQAYGVANGGYIPNLVQRSEGSSDPESENPVTVSTSERPEITQSVAGPAYTVLYAPLSDPRPAVKSGYIDSIPENSVLVLGLPLEQQLTSAPFVTVNNALYGGLMSTRAQFRKAAGSIVLGRIRDLAEHRDLGFPVWSYGVGAAAPGSVLKVVGIGVPVQVKVAAVDGTSEVLTIHSGDIMVADENGVVRVPLNHDKGPELEIDVDKILHYIPQRVGADAKVSDAIKTGQPAGESQKYWRGFITKL